jgi:hypothetical protein
MKNLKGRYSSIHDFISANNLEKEAEELFGKGWEAENDIEQVQELAGNNYVVHTIEVETERDKRADDYIQVISKSDLADFFEIYDEVTNKTLSIKAHSIEEAEGIADTIPFEEFQDGEQIDVLDDIDNYQENT